MKIDLDIEKKLRDLDIKLPTPPNPVASYVPFIKTQNLIFISGQICFLGEDKTFKGKIGDNLSTQDGYNAAKNCCINTLSQLKKACDGNLSTVSRCINLKVFVACVPSFCDHPKVANGASDLIKDIFADSGEHSRSAIGCTSLPMDSAVEIESIWETY